jgi:hypothetical protein
MEDLAIYSLAGSERVVCPNGFESRVRDGLSQKLLFG